MTTHAIHRFTVVSLASLLLGGCYTADLDPALGGAFTCDSDTDDEDEALGCPSGLTCVNDVCEVTADLPELVILSPEDGSSLETMAPDFPVGPEPPLYEFSVRLQGGFEVVPDVGEEHEFGEGHIVIAVDGEEQAVIEEGDLGAAFFVDLRARNRVGPHRVSAQMIRNDGEPYDHPGGKATLVFFLESMVNKGNRPFVAIRSPWPGEVLDGDDTELEVTLITKNFDFAAPSSGFDNEVGHAHVYYDLELQYPDCVDDDQCDDSYLGVAGAEGVATLAIPAAPATQASLTAVLRHPGHEPILYPFGCDRLLDLDACSPVFDIITVARSD